MGKREPRTILKTGQRSIGDGENLTANQSVGVKVGVP
jgi:hypothetical protein